MNDEHIVWRGQVNRLAEPRCKAGYGLSRIRDEAAHAGWSDVCLALGIVLLFTCLIRCSVEQPTLRRFRVWRACANIAQAVKAPTTYI